MFIKRLEVESFRGFVGKQVFNLGQSKVIILFGPNGHGKTSFFDALEWGLTGKLYRYDVSNDERNRSKFIANQTKKFAVPKVKIILECHDKEITIVRTGESNEGTSTDYGKSILEVFDENGALVDNPEVYLTKLIVNSEWLDKVNHGNINRMYNLTHNLGQEKITHFINDTKDGDRYNSLSIMLGTDYFRDYEMKFKSVRERINKEIDDRKDFLKEINNNKSLVNNEMELLLNQMQHQNITEKDIENLLKKFNEFFNLNITINGNFLDIPKLLNKLNSEEIEKEGLLTEKIRKIQVAQVNISKAKGRLLNEQELLYKSNKLRDLYNKKHILNEFKTLNIQLPQITKDRIKLQSTRNDKLQLNETISQLQKKYLYNYDLYNKLKSVIDDSNINSNFLYAIDFIKDKKNISKFFEEAGTILQHLNTLSNNKQLLEEQLELREKLYLDSQKHLEDVSVLKDQYKQLIKATLEYLDNHKDLSKCPICGTNGINKANIINQMNHAGKDDESGFAELVKRSQEYKGNVKKSKEEYQYKLKELKEYQNKLKNVLIDYDQALSREKVEIEALENEVKRISQNIKMDEAKLAEVEAVLLKHNLSIDLNPEELVNNISEKITNLLDGIIKIEKEFNLGETYNIDQLIKDNKQHLNEVKDEKNLLIQTMSSFGYKGGFDLYNFESHLASEITKIEEEYNINKEKKHLINNLKSNIDSFLLLDRIKEASAKLESYKSQFTSEEKYIGELNNDLKLINQLINAVPDAIDKLNNESLQKLFHLVQSIYNKINSHPLYRKIEFNASKRYNSNRLLLNVMTEEGVESNPTYIYSAAQIRTLAISIFLAMAIKQKWTSLDLICMDDPIQSMDDLNIISFIDLMRVLVSQEDLNKQFIISTHNSNFYDMLRKKFRMLDIGLIQYDSYGKNGPVFSIEEGMFSDEGMVKHEINQYNQETRNELQHFLSKN